jgi:hypothetical protein
MKTSVKDNCRVDYTSCAGKEKQYERSAKADAGDGYNVHGGDSGNKANHEDSGETRPGQDEDSYTS